MKNTQRGFIPVLILLVIAVVVIGGGAYYVSNKTEVKQKVQEDSTNNKHVSSDDTQEVMVTTNNKGTITGYYTHTTKTTFNKSAICDSFVVVSGEETLIAYFKDLIAQGNSINQVNAEGNLVLNLNLVGLNAAQKTTITNSIKTNPVSLSVEKLEESGKGGGACTSLVKITKINDVSAQINTGTTSTDIRSGSTISPAISFNGTSLMVSANGVVVQTLPFSKDARAAFAIVGDKNITITNQDINFDGYNDLAIMTGIGYGGVDTFYDYYVYDVSKGVYVKDSVLVNVSNPHLNVDARTITTTTKSGPQSYSSTYIFSNGSYKKK